MKSTITQTPLIALSLPKSLFLAGTLASGTMASLLVNFTATLVPGCPVDNRLYNTLIEGSCRYFNNYPFKAYAAGIGSGECEDPSKTPEVRLFSEIGCTGDLVDSFAITEETQCFERDAVIPGVTVVCV
ncbi:hypothetical protein BJX70DRAFT_400421 [Aspergillus crustosus]